MSKKDLWLRLKNYRFDHIVPPLLIDHVSAAFGGPDASTKAFASKIARKLGWSMDFALRALEEYKKFVYLGNVSDANVTPSKVIDQVWHEHILFSRAYREFCREVLGRDFDHNPELVPMNDQSDLFHAQYLETLDAYRTEFDMVPPADIWYTPKFRTSATRAPKKSNRSRPDRWGDDTPLYSYFDSYSPTYSDGPPPPRFGGDGGGFHGGGSSRDWGSHDGHSHSHSDSSHSHSDSSFSSFDSSDTSGSGGDGGDSGGGDGGGSGCSSSCSGGCSS